MSERLVRLISDLEQKRRRLEALKANGQRAAQQKKNERRKKRKRMPGGKKPTHPEGHPPGGTLLVKKLFPLRRRVVLFGFFDPPVPPAPHPGRGHPIIPQDSPCSIRFRNDPSLDGARHRASASFQHLRHPAPVLGWPGVECYFFRSPHASLCLRIALPVAWRAASSSSIPSTSCPKLLATERDRRVSIDDDDSDDSDGDDDDDILPETPFPAEIERQG